MDRADCHCEPVAGEPYGLSVAQTVSLPGCPDFGALASLYRWMEWISYGPWLQRCRCTWISSLRGCRRALVFGDGDGRFAARLLQANPRIRLEAVDASPAMLSTLLRRCGEDAARVEPIVGDARRWRPHGPAYDLVISHFFLDCLTAAEVRTLARSVRGATKSEALWVVSEFAVPANSFGRFVARPLIAVLYLIFGLLTGLTIRSLPDYAAGLREAGFELIGRRKWLCGLLTSELWSTAPVGDA